MKVKLLTLMAGPRGVFEAGEVVEVAPAMAAMLIAKKSAIAINNLQKEDADGQKPNELRKRPAERRGGKQ